MEIFRAEPSVFLDHKENVVTQRKKAAGKQNGEEARKKHTGTAFKTVKGTATATTARRALGDISNNRFAQPSEGKQLKFGGLKQQTTKKVANHKPTSSGANAGIGKLVYVDPAPAAEAKNFAVIEDDEVELDTCNRRPLARSPSPEINVDIHAFLSRPVRRTGQPSDKLLAKLAKPPAISSLDWGEGSMEKFRSSLDDDDTKYSLGPASDEFDDNLASLVDDFEF